MAAQDISIATQRRTRAFANKHTVGIRRKELLAKSVLWLFSGLTIVVLFLIVGYILVNGFYTRRVEDDVVLATSEDVVRISRTEDIDIQLIVNRRLRLTAIEWSELNEFLQNPLVRLRKHTWGFVTGQDIDVVPVLPSAGKYRSAIEDYFLVDDQVLGADVQSFGTTEEIVEFVRENRGAIGLIPAGGADLRGVDAVSLRRISVVVHPAILEVQRARRLSRLTRAQIEGLLTGSLAHWSEAGGPSVEVRAADPAGGDPGVYIELPVKPVAIRGDGFCECASDAVFPEGPDHAAGTEYVGGSAELALFVRNTPGAIGLVYYPDALEYGLTVAPVEQITHKRNLRLSFLLTPPSRAGAVGGVSTIIINTLVYIALTLLFATPIGVAAAVYLVEYAKQGTLVRILRIGTDTLAGIPSIIFGLFGLVVFAQLFGLKTGLLAGTLTVTIMILPTIVRTSEEALKTVPRDMREGSLALGATKLQTIMRVVIPAAAPGILTGMILAIGRAVGETAAVLYTIGSNMELIRSLNSPVRLLTVHLYMLIRETISIPNAFASATILMFIVFLVNFSTRRLISGRKSLHAK